MLILTRKLGESITIGDEIKVSVLGIRGRQVRLGIDAPSNIVVHREEIYLKVQHENRKATGTTKSDLLGVVKMIKHKLGGNRGRTDGSVVDYTDRKGRKSSGTSPD